MTTAQTGEILLPLSFTPKAILPTERLHVCLIGAGGTGARIALLLPRLLRAGDVVTIIDPDVVEVKNLARQHFHPDDVGKPKAEVCAERLAAVAPEGLHVHAVVGTIQNHWKTAQALVKTSLGDGALPTLPGGEVYTRRQGRTILFGAVDNRAARLHVSQGLPQLVFDRSVAWIDAGNDFRTGQVCLNLMGWGILPHRTTEIFCNRAGDPLPWENGLSCTASADCFPDTLDVTKDAADAALSCIGFDTQSVGANSLAAALAVNMFSWLLDGEEIGVMAQVFSTLSGVSPIPIMDFGGNSRGGYLLAKP